MKSLLIALMLIIGGVTALYARFKRVLAETGDSQTGAETQSSGGVEVENDDDFFGFDESEAEEAVAQQPSYFTYESPVEEIKVEAKPVMVMPEMVEENPNRQFDLRQAVIYQTLLNNHYINAQN